MIPLSPRLLCCASFVTGDFVLDIGTDHAYLPVYLVMSGKCREAIATDVRQGPLESAKNTVRHYRAAKSVSLILTDGFENVPPEGITDVVIAGMGGETIRDIIAADCAQWVRSGVNLILQPMTKAEVLRKWLAENGFAVTRETVVKDTKVYCVMQVRYTGEIRTISEAESYCGRLNPAELLTRIYIADVQKRLHTRASGLTESGQTEEAEAVKQLIAEINARLAQGGSR